MIYCRNQFDVINYATFHRISLNDVRMMRLATLQFEKKQPNGIIMGITIFKISFGEVYRRIYVQKSRFTAPLVRRRKLNFQAKRILMHWNAKIVSEYNQEIIQSQTTDNPMAPRGRAAQSSREWT